MSLFRFFTKKGRPPKSGAPVKRNDSGQKGKSGSDPQQNDVSANDALGSGLDERLAWFRKRLDRCDDFAFHPFLAPGNRRCALIYIKGFPDRQLLLDGVMESLMRLAPDESDEQFIRRVVERHQVVSDAINPFTDVQKALDNLFDGSVLLLMDGMETMIAFPLSGAEKRSVTEPPNEKVIRGPREAFIEDISVNLTLVRRRLKHPDLKMEKQQFGSYTNTDVYLLYMEGICRKELVNEVKKRLAQVQMDGVFASSYLEEFLEDNPYSPFPQIQYTERPDVVAASLLEGRTAVMVDGTPIQLLMPTNLFMFLQSPEDYYQRFYQAAWIRWIRYIFTAVSLFFPSIYIAVTTFHPEMLPTNLLLTVAAAREIVPFPAIVEALLMELLFEVIREGVLRVPQAIGQTVTVVGGLVIGQAAIQAGIVSAPLLIVVSVTGIASFVIPHFDFGLAVRLLRFPLMILAGTLGLFGIALGAILLSLHLVSLRTFGQPYLSPLAPMDTGKMQDVAVRAPWWSMSTRPSFSNGSNRRRMQFHNRPHHSAEEEGD